MPTDTRKPKLLAAAAFAAAVATGAAAGALLGGAAPSLAQETTTTGPADGAAADAPAPTEPDGARKTAGDRHCHHGVRPALAAAARALGMTAAELRGALDRDTSIADVAESRGVAPQAVVDALVADASERIDRAVADGELTAEQAEARKADLPERIAELVEHDGPKRPGPRR